MYYCIPARTYTLVYKYLIYWRESRRFEKKTRVLKIRDFYQRI